MVESLNKKAKAIVFPKPRAFNQGEGVAFAVVFTLRHIEQQVAQQVTFHCLLRFLVRIKILLRDFISTLPDDYMYINVDFVH